MKKFVLSIIIAAGGLFAQNANAQVGVNVGFRIGPVVVNVSRPVAPAVVYDDFYYLPDVEAYYSVPERSYYYMDADRRWVNAAYLPGRYHDYDWRSARRYEVRAVRPYQNHAVYRNRFGGGWNGNWNNNDRYAYRTPERRNDRDSYRRLPDSPYDSNNTWRDNNSRNDRNNDNRGGNYTPNRDRGSYPDQQGPQRSNGNDRQQPQGGYNRGGNDRQQNDGRNSSDNGRGSNPGYDRQQRFTQDGVRQPDNRMQMANVTKVSF